MSYAEMSLEERLTTYGQQSWLQTALNAEEAAKRMKMSYAWAMPSRWTFSIKPIRGFIDSYYNPQTMQALDPFYGHSPIPMMRHNDLDGGLKADVWLDSLPKSLQGFFNVGFFDPPYSPRQVAEVYKSVGLTVTMQDTQTAAYKKLVRDKMDKFIRPGGVVLSFGWNAMGMGKSRGYKKLELLVVDHGGDHHSTLCLAERKS